MRPSTLNRATLRLSSSLTAFVPPSGISARLATFLNPVFCESIAAPWQGPEPLSGIGEKRYQATIRSSRERSIGDVHWQPPLKSPSVVNRLALDYRGETVYSQLGNRGYCVS